MKYRIVEEKDCYGNVWNYAIQARICFIWVCVSNSRTLEHAKEMLSYLKNQNTRIITESELNT